MPRMPVLTRDEMDAEQQEVHDEVMASTGRVGRGPAIGFAWSAGLWRIHNRSSAHMHECSLTQRQVRIVSLLTAHHWNAPYPWSAQATSAEAAGLDRKAIEAINAGTRPDLTDPADAAVHDAARELLATGTLGDKGFRAAEEALGYRRMADIVGVIGHFCSTAMMANLAGAEPAADAPYRLRA